jgi:hypothetical protein
MKILSSSNLVAFYAVSLKQRLIRMKLNGKLNSRTPTPKATKLGIIDSGGIPLGAKLAQVILPKL